MRPPAGKSRPARFLLAAILLVVVAGPPRSAVDAGAQTGGVALIARQNPPADGTPAVSCATGRLRVADLPAIERDFEAGVAAVTEKALAWQEDARLVGLQVGCRLLEEGFNWRGIFFSEAIQTYFYSDTAETRTVDIVGPPGPELSLDDVSFVRLRLSLLRAGYDETVAFNPSTNVEIRLNSDEAPFGPPQAPRDEVYFHVAIESRGEVIDLFVNARDGTPYRYQF